MSPSKAPPRNLSVHFVGDDRERLVEAARRDGRTVSNMAAKLLREALARHMRQSRKAAPGAGA